MGNNNLFWVSVWVFLAVCFEICEIYFVGLGFITRHWTINQDVLDHGCSGAKNEFLLKLKFLIADFVNFEWGQQPTSFLFFFSKRKKSWMAWEFLLWSWFYCLQLILTLFDPAQYYEWKVPHPCVSICCVNCL